MPLPTIKKYIMDYQIINAGGSPPSGYKSNYQVKPKDEEKPSLKPSQPPFVYKRFYMKDWSTRETSVSVTPLSGVVPEELVTKPASVPKPGSGFPEGHIDMNATKNAVLEQMNKIEHSEDWNELLQSNYFHGDELKDIFEDYKKKIKNAKTYGELVSIIKDFNKYFEGLFDVFGEVTTTTTTTTFPAKEGGVVSYGRWSDVAKAVSNWISGLPSSYRRWVKASFEDFLKNPSLENWKKAKSLLGVYEKEFNFDVEPPDFLNLTNEKLMNATVTGIVPKHVTTTPTGWETPYIRLNIQKSDPILMAIEQVGAKFKGKGDPLSIYVAKNIGESLGFIEGFTAPFRPSTYAGIMSLIEDPRGSLENMFSKWSENPAFETGRIGGNVAGGLILGQGFMKWLQGGKTLVVKDYVPKKTKYTIEGNEITIKTWGKMKTLGRYNPNEVRTIRTFKGGGLIELGDDVAIKGGVNMRDIVVLPDDHIVMKNWYGFFGEVKNPPYGTFKGLQVTHSPKGDTFFYAFANERISGWGVGLRKAGNWFYRELIKFKTSDISPMSSGDVRTVPGGGSSILKDLGLTATKEASGGGTVQLSNIVKSTKPPSNVNIPSLVMTEAKTKTVPVIMFDLPTSPPKGVSTVKSKTKTLTLPYSEFVTPPGDVTKTTSTTKTVLDISLDLPQLKTISTSMTTTKPIQRDWSRQKPKIIDIGSPLERWNIKPRDVPKPDIDIKTVVHDDEDTKTTTNPTIKVVTDNTPTFDFTPKHVELNPVVNVEPKDITMNEPTVTIDAKQITLQTPTPPTNWVPNIPVPGFKGGTPIEPKSSKSKKRVVRIRRQRRRGSKYWERLYRYLDIRI